MTGGELLIVFLGLVAVAIVGFVVGRATASGSGQSQRLEEELEAAHKEHEAYKQEVNNHFERTAELFKDMTGAYRSLYNHMAESSGKLGVGPSDPLLEADPSRQSKAGLDYGTADGETDETTPADGETGDSAPTPEQPTDYAQTGQTDASKAKTAGSSPAEQRRPESAADKAAGEDSQTERNRPETGRDKG